MKRPVFITIKCLINCKSQSSCEILVSRFLTSLTKIQVFRNVTQLVNSYQCFAEAYRLYFQGPAVQKVGSSKAKTVLYYS
jgi:hypothetical protein